MVRPVFIEKQGNKTTMTAWFNVYKDFFEYSIYPDRESADSHQGEGRIDCVPVKIEWEEKPTDGEME